MGDSFSFSCSRSGCSEKLSVIRDDRDVAAASARTEGWYVHDSHSYCPAHNPERDGLDESQAPVQPVAKKERPRKGKKGAKK